MGGDRIPLQLPLRQQVGQYLQQGQLSAAIALCQQAIQQYPHSAEVYELLSHILMKRGDLDAARRACDRALQCQPDYALARARLGRVLLERGKQQGELDVEQCWEIARCLLAALQLQPDCALAHAVLYDLAMSTWTRDYAPLRWAVEGYLRLCPERFWLIAGTAFVYVHLKSSAREVALEKFLALETEFANLPRALHAAEIRVVFEQLLPVGFYLRDEPERNLQGSQRWAGEYATGFTVHPTPRNGEVKSAKSCRKVGFLSAHFWRHSVGWCSLDAIAALSQIAEVHLYASTVPPQDDRAQAFQRLARRFYQPRSLQIEPAQLVAELLEAIARDDIDVLVDLDGITAPSHAEVLYSKPAKTCVTWLGFEAPCIRADNGYIGDWHTHPPGAEAWYLETVWRMPHSLVAVGGFRADAADRASLRASLGIDPDTVAYLCVAPGTKFNAATATAQVNILRQVPNSILLYKGLSDRHLIRTTYDRACDREGIDPQRVKFLERTATEEAHRTVYLLADVLLDSYPYNGGTHSLEALWFCLPLVTYCGRQSLARMGYSFLQNLGIQAGIATSWETYVDWGVRLGKDADLRRSLVAQLRRSQQPDSLAPLWHPQQFARDFHALLSGIENSKPQTAHR